MIIGLHGTMGSGKDTAYAFFADWAQCEGRLARRDAFADRLKVSAARALGLLDETPAECIVFCNRLKQEGSYITVLGSNLEAPVITGREYLQYYGTEAHRQVFDSDFWVDACLPLTGEYPEEEILCITDVRFPNEAERIHALGGEVWRIDRPQHGDNDSHASEQPFADELIDVTIVNDGSLDHFRDLVVSHIERKAYS